MGCLLRGSEDKVQGPMELLDVFQDAQIHEDSDDVESAVNAYEFLVERFNSGECEESAQGVPGNIVASTALNCIAGHYLDIQDVGNAKDYMKQALVVWPRNAMASLNLANLEREYGSPAAANGLYKDITNVAEDDMEIDLDESAEWYQTWVGEPQAECLRTACYMLALTCHQNGDYQMGLGYLRRFNFKLRIAPGVWDLVGDGNRSANCRDSPVHLHRDAIPPELHKQLLKAFSPESPFWEATDYKTRGYFSFWYDVKKRPSNLAETLVQYLLPLTGRDDIVGAEWWVHSRPCGRNLGHQLHYDMEENSLEVDGQVLHPVVSSVSYLSGAQHGGPTVVFDQKPGDSAAETAFVANPVDGAFLTFPGNRLHGVLPGKTARDSRHLCEPNSRPRRLTLMVGFWNKNVNAIGKRHSLGPCSPFPRSSRRNTWPNILSSSKYNQESQPISEEIAVHSVSPAWETIQDETGCTENTLQIPEDVDQLFFLKSAEQFQHEDLHC